MFSLKVDDDVSLMLADPTDLAAYFGLIKSNHDHIGRFMDWVDNHQTIDNTRDYMLYARKQFGQGKEVVTKIYYQGEMVGSAGIIIHDKTLRQGEVGYWLDKQAVGKGIATRAARALTDYGFQILGLHKIIIRALPHNEASLAIPKRLGYKHQGLDVHAKRHYDEYYDFDTYYMLEDDWTATLPIPEFCHAVGDGIELRVLQPRFAETNFAVVDANRGYLRKWMPWVDSTTSVSDTLDFINSGLKQYADNDGVQMGIWYNGEFCGNCGYHFWDFKQQKTEIGYWLAQSFTGKGIMTRTVKPLVDYAFNVLDLHRVEILCAVENKASCAIPERLGFTKEGTIRGGIRVNDEYQDCHVYAVLAEEWGR